MILDLAVHDLRHLCGNKLQPRFGTVNRETPGFGRIGILGN